MEAIVDEIESELQQRTVREVSTLEIGELVLQQLRSLSEVAYVRFASVYRQFQRIRDFVETLDDLSRQSATRSTQPVEYCERLQSPSEVAVIENSKNPEQSNASYQFTHYNAQV